MTFFDINGWQLPEITLIGETDIAIKQRNMRRVCDDYIYYIVLDGEIFINEDGIEYHLKQGDCFMLEPGKLHYGTEDTIYNLMYIHFKHNDIKKITADSITDAKPKTDGRILIPKLINLSVTFDLLNPLSLIRRSIQYSYLTVSGYNILSACAVQEALIEIARSCFEIRENKNISGLRLANEVITFLNSNYKHKLTGAVIERELSYNFDYINQLFRRYFNCTVFQTLKKYVSKRQKHL